MSSGRNYSGSQLRKIFSARHDTLSQLHYGRFQAQRTRLQYNSDQTVLTIEQQSLNERVLVVHIAFVNASGLLATLQFLLNDYDHAQQNVQPQLLDQINSVIADLGVKLQNLEGRLRELEGIDVTDAQ